MGAVCGDLAGLLGASYAAVIGAFVLAAVLGKRARRERAAWRAWWQDVLQCGEHSITAREG